MTWIEDRRAWTGKYRKKKYTVSCKQLREDGWMINSDTKEGSYTAANGWWKLKKREIDQELEAARAARVGVPTPVQQAGMAFVAGGPVDQKWWEGEVALAGGVERARQLYDEVYQMFIGMLMAGHPIPKDMADHLGATKAEELTKAARVLRLEAVSKDTSAGGVAASYLETRLTYYRAGQLSAKKYSEKKTLVGHFVEFLGAGLDVATLDGAKWDSYIRHVLSRLKPAGPWGPDRARNAVTAARELVRWCYEQGLLEELPRNLQRRFRVKDTTGERARRRKEATWTAEEFKGVLSQATGRMRLFLLLMANCGFTQIDISDLKDSEVDWGLGKITRRRSKTGHLDQVPEVTYTLWPSTLALLREYRSGGPVVLVPEQGARYVAAWVDEAGVKHETDTIRGPLRYLQKQIGFMKPLKGLRKMGPTLLATHPEYSQYGQHFLGHATDNTADSHYVTPSQERFEAALLWLGRQLGQVE
jgi:integrase